MPTRAFELTNFTIWVAEMAMLISALQGIHLQKKGIPKKKRHSPAARQLAEKWVREGAAVEGFTLHARYAPSLRPVGTVRVLICDLPAGYEVQGITETLLTCAGYENASTLVVAEFLGTGVLASREVRAVGRSVFIVFFWNLQDQKVHRYFGSSQLGNSRNQPLCSTPEMSNTRYHSLPKQKITAYQKKNHSLPDAGQTRQMARRGSNMPPH